MIRLALKAASLNGSSPKTMHGQLIRRRTWRLAGWESSARFWHTPPCRSCKKSGERPGDSRRGSRHSTKSCSRPSPASRVTRRTTTSAAPGAGASLRRNVCDSAIGFTGCSHGLKWPTLPNLESADCHCRISPARFATSSIRAVRQRARRRSTIGEGFWWFSRVHNVCRYLGLSDSWADMAANVVLVGSRCVTKGDGRRQVFFQRDATAGIRVPHQALEVDLRRSSRVGVEAIDPPDLAQDLLAPVGPGGLLREAQAIGQEHGVRGDALGGGQVLVEHRRRHHERIADVGKPLARRAVGGELACGPKVDAGQVAHGVVVFHIVQPAHHHAPRITGIGPGLGGQRVSRPAAQRGPLRGGRLPAPFRRHLAAIQHLADLLPDLRAAPEVLQPGVDLQIQLAFPFGGRVTAQAKLFQDRPNLAVIVP